MWIVLIIVVAIVVILFMISSYNNLVASRQKVKNSWSQIEVQLQRRFDLIPNLVECVKGYMEHESDVLTKVTELRTSWTKASSIHEKVELNNELSETLKTIMVVSENYPNLKANENFAHLQEELANTENKLSFSRQFYNDTVTMYNTKIEVFPTNIIAGMFSFKSEELFKIDDNVVRENVKIDFNK